MWDGLGESENGELGTAVAVSLLFLSFLSCFCCCCRLQDGRLAASVYSVRMRGLACRLQCADADLLCRVVLLVLAGSLQ